MAETQVDSGTTSGRQPASVFRVLLRMDVHPGLERDFEQEWTQIAGVIACDPAILGQALMRSADGDSTYYVTSDWPDEQSFRRFELSEAHVEHRRRLHPYRRGGWMATTEIVCRV